MTASSHKMDTFHLKMPVNHITINQGTIHVQCTCTCKNCYSYVAQELLGIHFKNPGVSMQGQQNDLDNTICAINVTITYTAQILHSPQYGIIFYSPFFCHSKTKHTQSKVVQQVGQGNIKVNFLTPNKIQYHNITQRYNK